MVLAFVNWFFALWEWKNGENLLCINVPFEKSWFAKVCRKINYRMVNVVGQNMIWMN